MLRSFGIAAAMCICTFFTCAGQTPSPQQDPQAISILAQCNAAMGTPAKSVSLLFTGSIVDTDHTAKPRQLSVKAQGAYRESSTQQYPNEVVRRVYFGQHAWTVKNGKKTPLSASETASRVPELIPAYACEMRSERSLMDMQYLGRETRDGVSVDHIRIGFLHQKPTSFDAAVNFAILQEDLYIDSSSHLLYALKHESFSAADYGTHFPVETRYSAYSELFGLQIPMQTIHLLNGVSIEKTTITNVEQGAFSDADFK